MKNNISISNHRQGGSFAIELAFVLVGLCAIFLFSTDLSHKLLVRAKLDRSSFALTNILKERTRYFEADIATNKNVKVKKTDLEDLVQVASRMLNTAPENVALKVESMIDASEMTSFNSQKFDQLGCQVSDFSDFSELAPKDNAVVYPLYRVSLCETHDSWFDPFVGNE